MNVDDVSNFEDVFRQVKKSMNSGVFWNDWLFVDMLTHIYIDWTTAASWTPPPRLVMGGPFWGVTGAPTLTVVI